MSEEKDRVSKAVDELGLAFEAYLAKISDAQVGASVRMMFGMVKTVVDQIPEVPEKPSETSPDAPSGPSVAG